MLLLIFYHSLRKLNLVTSIQVFTKFFTWERNVLMFTFLIFPEKPICIFNIVLRELYQKISPSFVLHYLLSHELWLNVFHKNRWISVFGECGDDLVHERHNLLRHYMCFAVFNFINDTYAMFVVFAESKEAKADSSQQSVVQTFVRFLEARPLMIAHHMVLPIVLFPIFMIYDTGLGDCLLSIGFVMEASTPFVSARKILSLMGKFWTFRQTHCIN